MGNVKGSVNGRVGWLGLPVALAAHGSISVWVEKPSGYPELIICVLAASPLSPCAWCRVVAPCSDIWLAPSLADKLFLATGEALYVTQAQ